jgi:hypothetical protein
MRHARGKAAHPGIWLGALAVVTVLSACGTAAAPAAAPAAAAAGAVAVKDQVRDLPAPVPPPPAQRRQIVTAIDDGGRFLLSEMGSLVHLLPPGTARRVSYTELELEVTSVRVSVSTPLLASAVVQVLDRRGSHVLPATIVVLARNGTSGGNPGQWGWWLGPATSFPDGCTPAVEISLRELLCPDPWTVLGQEPPPGPGSGLGFTTPAGTTSIRSVNWTGATIPGAACGADSPIRLRDGTAFTESAVEPWWPAVQVQSWPAPVYGELAGQQVAAMGVICDNGDGMAEGQIGFTTMVYTLNRGVLKVIGMITPRQPLSQVTVHVPIMGSVTIRDNEVITHEGWYEPDGLVQAATTSWKLSAGVLRPVRTTVAKAVG